MADRPVLLCNSLNANETFKFFTAEHSPSARETPEESSRSGRARTESLRRDETSFEAKVRPVFDTWANEDRRSSVRAYGTHGIYVYAHVYAYGGSPEPLRDSLQVP